MPLLCRIVGVIWWLFVAAAQVFAAEVTISLPILAPVTGFMSLEGTSQRNGALLAVREAPSGLTVNAEVTDTGTQPEVAVNAYERVISEGSPLAVMAPMYGPQTLALLPLVLDSKIPLISQAGTAKITQTGNPYVFRFFPDDRVAKTAHVRYVLEELGKRRIAVLYQNTAYGQSGHEQIDTLLKGYGLTPVFEESVDVRVRDFTPILDKALAADPDALIVHLHSEPTALFLHQAAGKVQVPIVAGSAVHQPSTVALLAPWELKGVCGETNASPISGGSPQMDRFTAEYRKMFNSEPDGFALAEYDAVTAVLTAVEAGARTPAALTQALSTDTFHGLAMTYKSDGTGNMAHSSMIICYDGNSRVPKIVKRYDNLAGLSGK